MFGRDGGGGGRGLATALRQTARRQFHCHFLAFSARLSQTKATADSWFSGGGKKREEADRQTAPALIHADAVFSPSCFCLFFFLCTLLEGAKGALNVQLLCHYCQPGCLSANRRLNALPSPPPTPSSHYRLSSRVPYANHRTGIWQRLLDMSAVCLCSLHQGQALLISLSHTLLGGAEEN